MEWIVEKNCSNYQHVEGFIPLIKPILELQIEKAALSTLEYFVITDSEDAQYCNSVKKFAAIVGAEEDITQDEQYSSVGKTLNGIDKAGKQHQAILIRSWIWEKAAEEIVNLIGKEDAEKETLIFRYFSKVLHEIGHAIDNEKLFGISCSTDEVTQHDPKDGLHDCYKQIALSLWGEYAAESFACKSAITRRHSLIDSEHNLFDCIETYSMGTDNRSLFERVYRILYFFMLRIAVLRQHANVAKEKSYDYLRQDPRFSEYRPLLSKVELAIENLERDYPEWKSCDRLNELTNQIKRFLFFERGRQMRIKWFGK